MLSNYHIGRFVLGPLCVGDLVRLGLRGVRVAGCSLQHGHGYINVRNMLSTQEVTSSWSFILQQIRNFTD